MITKEEVWKIYIQKNPKFVEVGGTITFTEKGIKQFFDKTWDLAYKTGKDKMLNELNSEYENVNEDYYKTPPKSSKSDPSVDFLSKFFGINKF